MKNQICVPRQRLVEYFQGWADEDSSQDIENHLRDCRDCEGLLESIEQTEKPLLIPAVTVSPPSINGLSFNGSSFNGSSSDDLSSEASPTVGELTEEASATESTERDALSADLPSDLKSVIHSISHWETHSPALPHSEIGNYQILELIGRGGMAEVYRAKQKKLQRDVAIKVLHVPRLQIAESLQRIEREMAAVGRLNHPGIVAAIDTGEIDGNPFLVTEFIDGLDGSRLSRIEGPLKPADACEIVRQAAIALANAHGQGIVHRDLKPSNLMVDKSGVVKVLDFGLAHLEDFSQSAVELTTIGQLLGTLDYMAPEQAEQANNVDHRSDVYSLGATLFRLLTGRAPYAATTRQSALEKLRLLATTQPPKISTLRQELDRGLAKLVDGTLARSPDQRPASAAHLAEVLEPFCDEANLSALVASAWAKRDLDEGPSPSGSFLTAVEKDAGRGRGGNRWPMWLGFAGMFAALCFGIVITLDTMKGQVVIQTDSADVKVRLLKDGKTYKELEIHPGTTTTRLYAGQYEIQIDSGSDHYSIDKNNFQLKSGETIVATVRLQDDQQPTNSDATVVAQDHSELRRMWIEYLAAENSSENNEGAKVMRSLVLMDRKEEIRQLIVEAIEMLNVHRDSVVDRNLSAAIREFGLNSSQTELLLEKAFDSEVDSYFVEVISQLVTYSNKHTELGLHDQMVELLWLELENGLTNDDRESISHSLRVMADVLRDEKHPEYLLKIYKDPKLGLNALLETGYYWPWIKLDDREILIGKSLEILRQDELDLESETAATRMLVDLSTEFFRMKNGTRQILRRDLPATVSADIEETLSKIVDKIMGTKEMYSYVDGGIVYSPFDIQEDFLVSRIAIGTSGLPRNSVRHRLQLLLYLIKSAGDENHPTEPNPVFQRIAALSVEQELVQLLNRSQVLIGLRYKLAENGRYYPEFGDIRGTDGKLKVLDPEVLPRIFLQRIATNIQSGYLPDGKEESDQKIVVAKEHVVEPLLEKLRNAKTVDELSSAAKAIHLANAQEEAQEVLTQRLIDSIEEIPLGFADLDEQEFGEDGMDQAFRWHLHNSLVSATGIPLGKQGLLRVMQKSLEHPTQMGLDTILKVMSESNLEEDVWEIVWEFAERPDAIMSHEQMFLVTNVLLFNIHESVGSMGAGAGPNSGSVVDAKRQRLSRFFENQQLGFPAYFKGNIQTRLNADSLIQNVERETLLKRVIDVLDSEEPYGVVKDGVFRLLNQICLEQKQVPVDLQNNRTVWMWASELSRKEDARRLLDGLVMFCKSERVELMLSKLQVSENFQQSVQLDHGRKSNWSCFYQNRVPEVTFGEYILFLADRVDEFLGEKASEELRRLIQGRTEDAYVKFVKRLQDEGIDPEEPMTVRIVSDRGETIETWMKTQVFTGKEGRYRFDSNQEAALAVLHKLTSGEK